MRRRTKKGRADGPKKKPARESVGFVSREAPIPFGTKAETLERLAGVVTKAQILPQFSFFVREWKDDQAGVLKRIRALGWLSLPLAVRSSAEGEDGTTESLAGKFTSVLGVRGGKAITAAIEAVLASYKRAKHFSGGRDQVLIQPLLEKVALSGVAFSRDPNSGGPYLVINYDDASGSTASVTSGASNAKTFYLYRAAPRVPRKMKAIVELVFELEGLLGGGPIDIEFALDMSGTLFLLQVRPLVSVPTLGVPEEDLTRSLRDVEKRVREMSALHPYLHGRRTILGVMPDWNPAEMIGVRPRPLALSLYKELITDAIWAYQRDNYGYKNLRSFPLMASLAGQPYIDVRVDFNSFVPADVRPELTEKLVDYYIARLFEFPSNHDKVEFEILFTCYSFDLPERLGKLSRFGFKESEQAELAQSLRTLTNRIIHDQKGFWRVDRERIDTLEHRQKKVGESGLDPFSKIYWLLEDTKRYGTLPFAGLARAAFIAIALLRSLVATHVLSENDRERFMESLDTVGSHMSRDFAGLSRAAFLRRYGHLRPGTYDILSARYDEEPDRYFNWDAARTLAPKKSSVFSLTEAQRHAIDELLAKHGLDYDATRLFAFIKAAVEGREHAKFVFTRSISDALVLFKKQAEEYGLSPDDCSYADIDAIRRLVSSSENSEAAVRHSIEKGKRNFALTRHTVLPPLIMSPANVWSFELPHSEPNYITHKRALGPVAFPHEGFEKMRDSIILIPSADPGYDWVFSHGIAGFVTMYGGVNSHMAIRAGELGIPAIIGTGEQLFLDMAKQRMLEIDCGNRHVVFLS